jgi:hypothetical protein
MKRVLTALVVAEFSADADPWPSRWGENIRLGRIVRNSIVESGGTELNTGLSSEFCYCGMPTQPQIRR